MTTVVRSGVFAAVLLSVAACTPKGPAPLQCTSDANCFAGGVCNAGGTCVTGAAIDAAKSTIDISQSTAVADGQDEVTITVTVRDAAGNPLSSRGVRLSVDGSNNTLTQPSLSTNSVGQVTGKLTSTKAEPKTIHAVAGTVISSGNSPGVALSKTATVNFVADQKNVACLAGATGCSLDATKASSIKITADDGVSPPVVEVDTAKGIRIHLVVRDANGNLIANAPVTITPVGKDLVVKPAVGTTASDGSFTATVTSTVAQEATILVDVAGLHAVQVVTFNPGLIDPAHSPLAAFVGAVDPNNECDSDVPHDAICTIAAGTTDKVTITLLARDRFDNIVQDAEVWFSAPAGNENSGNTVAPDAFETRYCGDKSPPANCEGIRNAPLLTMPDGTVTASFVATKAGSDGVDIHIIDASGDKVVSLPVQVTAGNPDVSMSYFVVVGAADGTPTPADDSHNFAVIAYVADAFDNPIAGVPIAFSTLLCTATSGDPCSTTAAKPTGDTITPTQLPDSGKTDEAGLYSAFYSAQLTGWRQVSVTGGAVTTPQETLFVPGDPAPNATAMTLDLTSISADPGHPTHVSVVLKDKFGNATPNQNLTIDAKNGTRAWKQTLQAADEGPEQGVEQQRQGNGNEKRAPEVERADPCKGGQHHDANCLRSLPTGHMRLLSHVVLLITNNANPLQRARAVPVMPLRTPERRAPGRLRGPSGVWLVFEVAQPLHSYRCRLPTSSGSMKGTQSCDRATASRTPYAPARTEISCSSAPGFSPVRCSWRKTQPPRQLQAQIHIRKRRVCHLTVVPRTP